MWPPQAAFNAIPFAVDLYYTLVTTCSHSVHFFIDLFSTSKTWFLFQFSSMFFLAGFQSHHMSNDCAPQHGSFRMIITSYSTFPAEMTAGSRHGLESENGVKVDGFSTPARGKVNS